MEKIDPTVEHAWLQRLVGEWTVESSEGTGKEIVSPIGPFWVQCEGTAQMRDGTPFTMILTLGYDVRKKKFVGTWYASEMTDLWVYDITRDATGNVLTMAVEGPAMQGEGTANYRDVIEWKGPDEREFSAWVQGADGEWTRFMQSTYRRVK
jgi:hypothetical protein